MNSGAGGEGPDLLQAETSVYPSQETTACQEWGVATRFNGSSSFLEHRLFLYMGALYTDETLTFVSFLDWRRSFCFALFFLFCFYSACRLQHCSDIESWQEYLGKILFWWSKSLLIMVRSIIRIKDPVTGLGSSVLCLWVSCTVQGQRWVSVLCDTGHTDYWEASLCFMTAAEGFTAAYSITKPAWVIIIIIV